MLSRVGTIALLVVLGILFVVFFPATRGPFTVTHGPATAHRALATIQKRLMLLCGLLLVSLLRLPTFAVAVDQVPPSGHFHDLVPLALRC